MAGYRQFGLGLQWGGGGFGGTGKGGVTSLYGGPEGIAHNRKRNADAAEQAAHNAQQAAAANAWKNPELVDDAARAMNGGQPAAPDAPVVGPPRPLAPPAGGSSFPGIGRPNVPPEKDAALAGTGQGFGGGAPPAPAVNTSNPGMRDGWNMAPSTPAGVPAPPPQAGPPRPSAPQGSMMYGGQNAYKPPMRYRG